ncbi:AfsR/SARP family transcriptional regulator [Nocardia concava]|uniref:AfsR/SARP family transcriptional regulator n=1 Tax=Nocardia concava TaxID=257281 RepID=UPI00030958AD|nr:BTAD domain-containing putative transcriptional regulator [Nocardia concava]
MDARILGPLTIADEGVEIDIPSARQRTLLVALLINANRPASTDQLIEVLWGCRPPQNSLAALRTYIMRLRRHLGNALGVRIVTRPDGYLIEARENEVDLTRFQSLYTAGRTAVGEGDWESAAKVLKAALSLWRGEPFTEIPSEILRERELPRLEQLHLRTQELYFEAQLARGEHKDIVLELQRAVEACPLREQFWAQLMTALYRSRRKAEALDAFQAARTRLIDELGVDPGPDLQALHQAMLTDEKSLWAWSALIGSEGSNVRLVEPTAVVPRQLPAAPRHFTGRTAERSILQSALNHAHNPAIITTTPILVISGIGGIGKTALALHWAHRAAELFPDGQIFINLRGFDIADNPMRPETAVRLILDAFSVPEQLVPTGLDAQVALLRSTLADKRVLLVLDNARNEEQLIPLLPGNSGSLIIVTSRNKLPGLLVSTGAKAVPLGPLEKAETVELLEKLIGKERLTAEPGTVDRLVSMCDRIPLAASILACRVSTEPQLPMAALIELFEDTAGLMDRFDTGDAATSIRTLLASSFRNLTVEGQHLLRFLGLHRCSRITPDTAASLADMSQSATRRAFADLSRNHLVEHAGVGHYSLHDIIRAFAAEVVYQDTCEETRRTSVTRLYDFLLHTLDDAARLLVPGRLFSPLGAPLPRVRPITFREASEGGVWFSTNQSAIMSAVTHAVDDNLPEYCWKIVERASSFFSVLGQWHDWHRVARLGVDAATFLGDLRGEANCRLELGSAMDMLEHDKTETLAELTRALSLFAELGDRAGEALAHHHLARYYGRRAVRTGFGYHSSASLRLYQADSNDNGHATALNTIGWFSTSFGEYDRAISTCRAAIDIYSAVGNLAGEADSWDSLAWAHQRRGDLKSADACYRKVIPMDERLDRIGHRYNIAETQHRYGDLRCAMGDVAGGIDYWRRAQQTLDELNHPSKEIVRQKILHITQPEWVRVS